MPQHNHGVTDPGHAHGGGQASSQNGLAGTYAPAPVVWTSAPTNTSAAATGISIQNAGSGAAHNNTQPTIILNYIIKT
jgi:microcystin-dependent protein